MLYIVVLKFFYLVIYYSDIAGSRYIYTYTGFSWITGNVSIYLLSWQQMGYLRTQMRVTIIAHNASNTQSFP